MTTQKQIEANKLNSRKSTGPRTVIGKRNVTKNAMIHGMLARDTVIVTGDGREDIQEFKKLVAALRAQLSPKGVLEEILVDIFATKYWRLRRGVRRERGLIQGRVNNVEMEQEARRKAKLNPLLINPKAQLKDFIETGAIGISHLLEILVTVIAEIEENGYISNSKIDSTANCFDLDDQSDFRVLVEGSKVNQKDPDTIKNYSGRKFPDFNDVKEELLKIASEKRCALIKLENGLRSSEAAICESLIAIYSVPNTENSEAITRYELSLEKGMYKALHELQRLQAYRLGISDKLPVAVDINIDSTKV